MAGRLSRKDFQGMEIDRFIFHVLIKDEDTPRHLDAVPLDEAQKTFFRKVLEEATQKAIPYEFVDTANSDVFDNIQRLIHEPEEAFLAISKKLASSFHSHHKGSNTADGIFIVGLARLAEGMPLVFLMKMDHQEVLRYKLESEPGSMRAILEKVTNPLVQHQDAIQKLALIEPEGHFEWEILANDRNTPSQRVAQYFESFLSMKMSETSVHLMEKAVSAVRHWAVMHEEELDGSQEVSDYKERAVQYMSLHDTYEPQTFAELVVEDPDVDRKGRLKESLLGYLEEEELTDKTFETNPDLLRKSTTRHAIVTREGVKIEWTGNKEDNFLFIQHPDPASGMVYQITISTEDIQTIK